MNSIQANLTGRKTVGTADSVDPDELLDANEAARLLRQKPQTLAAWRSEGRGPEYIKIGRSVFYQRSRIGLYLAARDRGQGRRDRGRARIF
jgi:hypothetical protein